MRSTVASRSSVYSPPIERGQTPPRKAKVRTTSYGAGEVMGGGKGMGGSAGGQVRSVDDMAEALCELARRLGEPAERIHAVWVGMRSCLVGNRTSSPTCSHALPDRRAGAPAGWRPAASLCGQRPCSAQVSAKLQC